MNDSTPNRIVKETKGAVVSAGKAAVGVIQKAKKAVEGLGKERFDRATYTSPKTKDLALIKQADAILSNRPDILNESDQSDPEFRTVVSASALRGK